MILNTNLKKAVLDVFLVFAIVGAIIPGSATVFSREIPPDYRYKNQQVALPPEIAAFISAKEKQAEDLAQQLNLELDPAIKKYFTIAKSGRIGESQQLFGDINDQANSTNVVGQLAGPIWQVIIDAKLAVDAYGENDADLVLATTREMVESLPAGCVYFGGTDPGRGLPTMFCSAPGDPFSVLTQNQLEDGRYLRLLQVELGSRIQLPTTNEVQKCIEDYKADVQIRAKQGKLKPGENFRMVDGKPKVYGQVSYMEINGRIAKMIFDKNPDHEFYYEESFPLDWMYPYLTPHGLLMKLNRQPLNEIPAGEFQKDEDFWSKELAGKIGGWLAKGTPLSNVCAYAEKVFANKDTSEFKGDSKFIASKYALAYSKWRSSIAGIYAWRLSPQCPQEYGPKNDAQRKQLMKATDFAYEQACALCPYSPEAVYRYVNFLLPLGRFDDAILIAKTALDCSPMAGPFSHNEQIKGLIDQLEKFKEQSSHRRDL